jgi:hypothetical protein
MVKPIIKLEPMPTPTPTPEPKVYPLFRNLTNNPIWFKQENGTVIEIYPSLQDREEIINIKRSIVSALQVTIRDQDGVWSETEVNLDWQCSFQNLVHVIFTCFRRISWASARFI